MLRLIVFFLLFYGTIHQCWAVNLPGSATMSIYDPVPPAPRPPEEPGSTDPRPSEPTVSLPIAPSTYCSNRARPLDNESHYRFAAPVPDQSYNSPGAIKLPASPGDVYHKVNPGKMYTFKFRFRSDLLEYPKKTKMAIYRYPGYEDKYPQMTNWICNGDTSGIQPPISGVAVILWRGDRGGGSLAGYYPLYNVGAYPPFNTDTSGVYGFTYTPNSSQVGQTMEVRVVAQTGVTANERDYQRIYESDQSLYKIFIKVENAPLTPAFWYQEVHGLYENIQMTSGFAVTYDQSTISTPPPVDDVIKVEYYVDGVLAGWNTPTKTERNTYHSEYYLVSQRYPDGVHQYNVRGYTQSGNIIISPIRSFNILNYPTPGPAPVIYPARIGTMQVIAVTPPTTDLSFLRVVFYSGDGRFLTEGRPIDLLRRPNEWYMVAPIDGREYTYYAIVYYNNGARGISSVLNYQSVIPPPPR